MSDSRFSRFPLKKGEVISVANPAGAVIKVDRGQLWITQTNQHEDIFIAAGASYAPKQNGLVVIQAMESVLMSLTLHTTEVAPARAENDSLMNIALQGA